MHHWIKLRRARAEMESTGLNCLKALLSTGIPLLEYRNTMDSGALNHSLLLSALCSLCASHYSGSVTLNTVSELGPCTIYIYIYIYASFLEGIQTQLPPPCLGWSRHLPGAGTVIPAGLLPPCSIKESLPRSVVQRWSRGH